jgi:hypothetical protein
MSNRFFLIFCSIGLVPIALGYGASPSVTMNGLFGITVDGFNLTHILRAVLRVADSAIEANPSDISLPLLRAELIQ